MSTGFEPDGPPPLLWTVLTVWIGGAVFSFVVWVLAAWALMAIIGGCATGRVASGGTIHGSAIGEGAKLERCVTEPTGPAGWVTSAPVATTCTRVEGGPIIPSLISIIGSALSGAVQFIGALWGPAV